MKLYDLDLSGNCQKVRMLLGFLNIPYEKVPVNFMGGEHKSEKFLRMNPKGEIPILVDGDVTLYDSQAILVYLARKYDGVDWWPSEAEAQARVMVWLSTAANEIFHGPAAARLNRLFKLDFDYDLAAQRAQVVLKLLDGHLRERKWLALTRPTLADICRIPIRRGGARRRHRPGSISRSSYMDRAGQGIAGLRADARRINPN